MTKIIKIIRRTLAALLLVVGTVVVATVVYCYYYQDSIIRKFINEVNDRLNDPIQVNTVQLTVHKSFPNIALLLHDVAVKDPTDTAAELITARKVYCVFDIWKLIQGQYVLEYLELEHGNLHLKEDLGRWLGNKANVQEVAQQPNALMVKLHKIRLKNIEIVYSSKQRNYKINTAQIQANLTWAHTGLEVALQGRLTIQRIQSKGVLLIPDLPVSLQATLHYDRQANTWVFQPLRLNHGSSLLTLQGNWGLSAGSCTALLIQGKKIDPQILLQCLSEQYRKKLKSYNLQGALSLNLDVSKQPNKLCALQGDFVLCDGSLTAYQFTRPLELLKLAGRLSIPNVQDLKTATLSIDKMTGILGRSKLVGTLILQDVHNLHLQCTAQATLDIDSLSKTLAHAVITDASGELDLYWQLEANLLQLIRGAHVQDNLSLSGALQAQTVCFKLGQSKLSCKDLMGNMTFQNNAIVMRDFSGSIGSGNFVLDGTIQNLLPYLFSDHQKIYVDAKLYTDYLDLDTLLDSKHETTLQVNQKSPAVFNIAPYWVLNIDCDIQQLHFRRFRGKSVRGKVKVKDQKLFAEKLQLGLAKGKIFLNGVLDASTDYLKIHTSAKLQDVQIANLFYMFENFHQEFVTDRHLSGEMFADCDLTIQADKQWNLSWEALQADIDARLCNGGLHNFEPMQQLAKYVDQESFTNLRFSEIKNRILIRDRKIYLPPMAVYANLTRIQLSGTHTFDGKIAYNVGIPLKGFQELEGGRNLEEMPSDTSTDVGLFFKLRGYTNNYKISYDAEAASKSLKSAFRKQGRIINAIIQGKYREKKQLQELAQDDYFEFDQ